MTIEDLTMLLRDYGYVYVETMQYASNHASGEKTARMEVGNGTKDAENAMDATMPTIRLEAGVATSTDGWANIIVKPETERQRETMNDLLSGVRRIRSSNEGGFLRVEERKKKRKRKRRRRRSLKTEGMTQKTRAGSEDTTTRPGMTEASAQSESELESGEASDSSEFSGFSDDL